MVGYIFNTIEEAIDAQNLCDTANGYPKNDSVTKNWVSYQFSNLDNFYFITFDESIREILGEPLIFDVTYEAFN
jgi:hypothetical protein